ncbi:hypothetical protein C8R46DRAFT_1128860 [Mycena filopes]|nr:hypothetical protein C8R46DRAFT_1128860 [Mycena filopes]
MFCKLIDYLFLCDVGLGILAMQCMLSNVLGHAILAISHPDTYLPTLHSSVLSSIYGALIIIPLLLASTGALAICIGCFSGDDSESVLPTSVVAFACELCIPVPTGVVINVVGVSILRAAGFQGPLPSLAQAAGVGAAGQALMMCTHLWRFKTTIASEA